MDVSIIIVNYNTISLLANAVDSVFEKTDGLEYEIIVVDNNSSDNSKKILAEKYGDRVIFIGLSENIGFGRANNEGAKIATGRNLFFLNPDTILLNNAVKILSDYLDSNPCVGCCGGNLFDADGNPAISYGRVFLLDVFEKINALFLQLPEKFLYAKNKMFNYTNKPLKVAFICGADLMIQKNLFNILKGFDSDFFMYYEEAELEYRASKAGYKIISVPYAKIIHLEGKSLSNNYERLNKYFVSQKVFMEKTCNPKTYIIYYYLFLQTIIYLFVFIILQKKSQINFWLEAYRLFIYKNKDSIIVIINEYFKMFLRR